MKDKKHHRPRMTQRDNLIVQFVAEQDACRLDTIQKYLGIKGISIDLRQLRNIIDRLVKMGFVRKDSLLARSPYIVSACAPAIRFAGIPVRRGEKPFVPLYSTIHHPIAVARVRIEYEVPEAVWTCERQLRQEYGDYHLADGMVIYGNQRYLIEVDRTQKESNRFQNIASINASLPDVDEVHYWTTSKLIPFVSKQMKSLDKDLQTKIKIFTLPSEVNE